MKISKVTDYAALKHIHVHVCAGKSVLGVHSKIDKTKVLKTNMKIESIAQSAIFLTCIKG